MIVLKVSEMKRIKISQICVKKMETITAKSEVMRKEDEEEDEEKV
jgi:hypothetical protein